MRKIRIAMAQINPTVGALRNNAEKILRYTARATAAGCDIIVFPELALTGYPPEDLLLKPAFIEDNLKALSRVTAKVGNITAIVGFVDRKRDSIYNACAVIHRGRLCAVYHKMFLPNYGVFDEKRYFQAGSTPLNVVIEDVTIGIGICEDIWYPEGPARIQALAGAHMVININASPYHYGKARLRQDMLITRAIDNEVVVVYNNMVGGQDELVFDGQGMIIDEQGNLLARTAPFKEQLLIADIELEGVIRRRLAHRTYPLERVSEDVQKVKTIPIKGARIKKRRPTLKVDTAPIHAPQGGLDEVLGALITGTRDYVKKNRFKHCVIGLSGGIDSSLVAAIAVKALGKNAVTGVFMPSRYSSVESKEDATLLARNLGIEFVTISIEPIFEQYLRGLKPHFKNKAADITEENIQARIRGNILMALSNKFGWLVLTTGNKSEMSVGYATLYGDMAGGFAVIKDVPKTLVYELAHHINEKEGYPLIPERVLTKKPTAELRPNQTDQDTLPPYEVLDPILKAYVEQDKALDEIVDMGYPRRLVKRVINMVDRSEYKRRQAPPGIKITPRAFGKDRRMPITNHYEAG